MKQKDLKLGMVVTYVPKGASPFDHSRSEVGVVTSWNERFVFVRYGDSDHSKATSIDDLLEGDFTKHSEPSNGDLTFGKEFAKMKEGCMVTYHQIANAIDKSPAYVSSVIHGRIPIFTKDEIKLLLPLFGYDLLNLFNKYNVVDPLFACGKHERKFLDEIKTKFRVAPGNDVTLVLVDTILDFCGLDQADFEADLLKMMGGE